MYAYVTEELPLVLRELPSLDVHTVRLSVSYPQKLRSCKCLLSNAHAAIGALGSLCKLHGTSSVFTSMRPCYQCWCHLKLQPLSSTMT